jgi:tRNA dimethylallyltransferase
LEVFRITGQPLSTFPSPWSTVAAQGTVAVHGASSTAPDRPFRFFLVGLKRNREELYRRINARTGAMFKSGLADEVRRLFEAGYTPADPGLRAIGYREFFIENPAASLPGDASLPDNGSWRLSEDLAGVEALIAQNSRRYAKRQITFFASLPGVKWIDCDDEDKALKEIDRILKEDIWTSCAASFMRNTNYE